MSEIQDVKELRFWKHAERAPDQVAIVDSRGRSWSRREFQGTINRISRALQAAGFSSGDCIAILAPNCMELVAAYMAAMQTGLYAVPINWHLTAPEVDYILRSSGARALFAHERLAALVGALGESRVTVRVSFGRLPGFQPLETFTAGHSPENIENPRIGRMLMYTSATTGRPKAIQLPLADAETTLDRTLEFGLLSGLVPDGEVHLSTSMLYHAGPLDFIGTSLHSGHRIVITERWEPEPMLELVQQHRVTTSFMVPPMFVRLLKLPAERRDQYDVSSLKIVIHTAAPCPVETKRNMIQWWGPVLREGYGAAEGGGTAVNSTEWLEYPGTVGRPIPGSKIKILDDEGAELPPGSIGTIYLTRHQGDRFEYKDDPEKTRSAYQGEFFTVGDVGYLNDAGYLFICDRKIDMIIRGGMNIYSAEIEQVLVQHPKVEDCAVFGVPDELMGEAVKAVVQLVPGVTPDPALTLDIMAFLRERLASIKVPRHFEYADALPRDPSGKLFKRRLRDAHWVGRERLI